jgi:hypothetical protein
LSIPFAHRVKPCAVQVMLFGAHKNDIIDRTMQITVAYNTFGPGLVQRIPR